MMRIYWDDPYDQSGDVYQWNETDYSGIQRGIYGGGFGSDFIEISSTGGGSGGPVPASENEGIGFRVASVPEPSSILLLLVGAGTVALRFLRNLGKGE
jgi:hypothetical protein